MKKSIIIIMHNSKKINITWMLDIKWKSRDAQALSHLQSKKSQYYDNDSDNHDTQDQVNNKNIFKYKM